MKTWNPNRVDGYGKWRTCDDWTPDDCNWRWNWISPRNFIIIEVIVVVSILIFFGVVV